MSTVMETDRIGRTVARIAHEVVERNRNIDEIGLIGIRRMGRSSC